jgi:hypothetical protein
LFPMMNTNPILMAWKSIGVCAFLGIAWVVSSGCAPSVKPGVVLVEDGRSLAPIVLFEGAPPFVRQAAEELAGYIEKSTGVRPEIIEGQPDPLPGRAIWVGYQPILRDIFPGVDFEFQHPEEILIAANENGVVIAGRDRWNPDQMTVETAKGGKIEGKQQEYGTVNAVYTFLQDQMGIRWLWPGELGEDVPKIATLEIPPMVYRYHPQIRGRSGVLSFSSLAKGGYGTSTDWTRHQRLMLDSLSFAGGHAFGTWSERFQEEHPEYFALQPDGSRSKGKNAKLCHSNPDVAKQWLADVEEQLAMDSTKTVFNASPNDGWSSEHCICENCLAWDHPDGEKRMFSWRGLTQEYVALSDREVTFANRCARLLKERFPDKDYYVLTMAYGLARPTPVEAVPDDNVIISSVANFFGRRDEADRACPEGKTHRQQFSDWGDKVDKLIWRPNTGSPAGWQQGLPDVPLRDTMEDMRFVADKGCVGIFIDSVWEHWATQGPVYYLLGQLAWNPRADGEAILRDYYKRGFGPAAGDIEAYWNLMEESRIKKVTGDLSFAEVYDQSFYEKAYGLLDKADKAVSGQPEKYAQRIAFVRAGLDWTALVNDTRQQLANLKASKGKDEEALSKARANWEKMEKLAKENPYAINWGPVRPQTPRMSSFNPDA